MSTILLISPEKWQWQFVSKHHYAITLANRGEKVYFLNPPNSNLNTIEISSTEYKNIYEIDAPEVLKGIRFLPKFMRVLILKKWLKQLEDKIEERFSTVWLFESFRFYDMDFAEDRLKIYHQVDSNQDAHTKEASKSADICFCVTNFIKQDIEPFNKNVHKISHGLQIQKVSTTLSIDRLNRINRNKINATFIGNFDAYDIDIEIFNQLTHQFPEIAFHFVGSYREEGQLYQLCKKRDNIDWWGRVESNLIPLILERMDINLVVYDSKKYLEQTANSHKILEYLASGKVIVATYTDEYKDKRHLMEMSQNNDNLDFIHIFEKVSTNLSLYNAKEKTEKRLVFAQNHTYEKQLLKIINLLEKENLKL